VRRLTPIQARYIKTFYGDQVLHQLEALEARMPDGHLRDAKHHAVPAHTHGHGHHHHQKHR
jgi:hypothetical protein